MGWSMNWFRKKEDESKNADSQDNNYQHMETVREIKLWNLRNIFFAFWIFILFIAIAIVAMVFIADDTNTRIVLWAILSVAYAIILFFLLEPGRLKEVLRKEIRTVEREVPIIKEVIRTVDRPVEVEVEKPVYIEKPIYIEKPVYIERKKEKLVIPKYNYVASMLTKTYHKSNCRLGKSIKKKYKEHSNNPASFKKKKYKPCKSCITKQVKV
jgi:hypothetical protein